MSFDLGDPVPLSISILDAAGQAADAGLVSVAITLPDGTTVTQSPISSTTTGVYDYDYATVQAGRHNARWLATGINACAFNDAFDVDPADGGDFISLADLKHHLKKTDTADDEKLRGHIGAACDMITDRMGQVSPLTVVADRPIVRGTVVLPRPVISVTSVASLPGPVTVPAADPATGATGWTLENREGVMFVTGVTGLVRVTLRAGRSPLPKRFRLAALELAADLWRHGQHNAAGGRPALVSDEQVVPGTSYALPYRVRQLLGLDKLPRDEVLVG